LLLKISSQTISKFWDRPTLKKMEFKNLQKSNQCYDDESYFDDFDDYDAHQELFDNGKRSMKKQKAFAKKLEGANFWNVGNATLSKLKQLAVLEIPSRSKKVLSKLIINHQLEEIKSIVKIGTNTTVLHAKVSQNVLFRDLESCDVIIKVFNQNNNKKPDIKAAEDYKPVAYYKRCWYDTKTVQIENVVIVKMIGTNNPAKNLCEMIEENPKKLRFYYCELLAIIKRHEGHWISNLSMENILWHNNEFAILGNGHNAEDATVSNYVDLVNTFKKFGLPIQELKRDFYNISESLDHNERVRAREVGYYEECLKELGWDSFYQFNVGKRNRKNQALTCA
jgi:hypothetical protein